jgi:serine/threonine-protein kinase
MRLGPYEIQSAIGAGGMGEVYRARDTRLERDVALKVLPAATLGDGTARARLVREARLASRLNHPHICTIYDVGETDSSVDSAGSPEVGSGPRSAYIAMELVEGQPLSVRVAEGPLPTDQVVRYGQQLAEALAHAHGRGVVHRDLKSANVVVTPEGQVKVLDFGLAKRLTEEALAEATTVAPESLMAPGIVAGTLAYMAPEQLRGRPADARSDIWALGGVLYEMAAGRRPFVGQTGFELTAAIFSQPVPPMPAPVPGPVSGVVERCLAKEPGERYQRAGEVKAALEAVASGRDIARWPTWRTAAWRRRRRLGGAAGALAILLVAATLVALDVGGVRSRWMRRADPIRLAVLPFANLSGDAGQGYLSDGLTQEMITQLGRLHPATLSVIARTSVMRYKKGDTPVDQIGRELDVDYVLEGSTTRQGDRVSVAAELINVANQTTVWADKYEREFSAILTVQGQVAQNVAKALAVELLPAEEARLAIARSVNPEAYEAYLKGITLWQTLKTADVDAAQCLFEQALEKDPSYAPAYSGLALVWMSRALNNVVPPLEAGPKAKAAALKAIELDGNSAEAHEALADVLTWSDWNWAEAGREWERALELNPNAASTHAYYSHYLAHVGRAAEGEAHSKRALELDPFNPLWHGFHGMVLLYQRRYDEALAAARTATSMRADAPVASNIAQWVYLSKGMRDEQLADQRLRIATDPERMAAFERGLKEGGYEGA